MPGCRPCERGAAFPHRGYVLNLHLSLAYRVLVGGGPAVGAHPFDVALAEVAADGMPPVTVGAPRIQGQALQAVYSAW